MIGQLTAKSSGIRLTRLSMNAVLAAAGPMRRAGVMRRQARPFDTVVAGRVSPQRPSPRNIGTAASGVRKVGDVRGTEVARGFATPRIPFGLPAVRSPAWPPSSAPAPTRTAIPAGGLRSWLAGRRGASERQAGESGKGLSKQDRHRYDRHRDGCRIVPHAAFWTGRNRMKTRLWIAGVGLMSAAAAAGPFDQPYALVERGDASELRKEATLAITKIDGVSTRNPRQSDPIPPGEHKVTVRFDTGRGVVSDNSRELALTLEPCVRYRVVAVYRSKTNPDWEPKVYPEPIGECRRKFKLDAKK
jgi:hypothetical protein